MKSLDIIGCKNITNDAIIKIAERCPALESLGISGCKNITNDAYHKNC